MIGGARLATAGLGVAAGALGYEAAWREPRSLVCPEVPLALPGWPAELDGLRVALVADLHAGAGHMTPARLAATVDAVLALRADVHLLLGDYIDSTHLGKGRARVRDVARELARLPRSAAVLGNHDWRGAGPAMGWALRDAGVRVLENEAVPAFGEPDSYAARLGAGATDSPAARLGAGEPDSSAARLAAGSADSSAARSGPWIAGVACTRHRFPDVRAALRDVPDGAAVLLAVHDPDYFPDVPARPALTVAGHLHGGQVNVPLLRRAVLPTSYGERYLAGHVVERGRQMYVSAGIGTAGLPLRLRRPPEVPVLRLTAAAPTAPAR